MDRRQALQLVNRLSTGRNVIQGVGAFSCGRERWVEAQVRGLEELAETDDAAVKFIKGVYGDGKTNLIARIREAALERGWVVSYVEVSDRVHLYEFEEVLGEIVRHCECAGMIADLDSEYDPPDMDGWRWILDAWCAKMRETAATGLPFGRGQTMVVGEKVQQMVAATVRRCSAYGDFASAVRAYVTAWLDRDTSTLDLIMRWFRADGLKLREHGILSPVTRRNAKDLLRNLVAFLRSLGYRGLVAFVDEVDRVLQYTPKRRQASYQLLRELMDNVDGRHGLRGACIYFAIVPDLVDGSRGFAEHEGLASRLEQPPLPLPAGLVDYRSAMIDLSQTPLTADDRMNIARRLREIHAIARAWQPSTVVSDEVLRRVVEMHGQRTYGRSSPRSLCKAVVAVLEGAEQYGSVPEADQLQAIISSASLEELRSQPTG